MNIEPLEPRIAPAAVFTYTDIDGDLVTITASKGTGPQLAAILTFSDLDAGDPRQLRKIDFSQNAAAFAGTNLTITAKRGPTGGDGVAHVGYIDADDDGGDPLDAALDLGAITIKGDLGAIDAGDANIAAASPAIKSLSVRSMGLFGLVTQGGAGELESNIKGSMIALKVAGDVQDVRFFVDDGAMGGTVGSLRIGGDLVGGSTSGGFILVRGGTKSAFVGGDIIGGSASDSGVLVLLGQVGSVEIAGSLLGGVGNATGHVVLGDVRKAVIRGDLVGNRSNSGGFGAISIASLTVGGSVMGGSGNFSGDIQGGTLTSVKVMGSVIGGTGQSSGQIGMITGSVMGTVVIGGNLIGGDGPDTGNLRGTSLGSLSVGGSIIGGLGDVSGGVLMTGAVGAVKIGRDLVGASANLDDSLDGSGFIQGQRIGNVTIGGSIISGIHNSTGTFKRNAAILSDQDIGAIVVKGSLVGNEAALLSPVIIAAHGQATLPPGATIDLAIKSLTVGGRVEHTQILAGYTGSTLLPTNGNASIGPVKVGKDWIASDLVAGIVDTGANGFGTTEDDVINNTGDAIFARIASIQIGGIVIGSATTGDHFGFTAERIGSFKFAGITIPLNPAATDLIHLSRATADATYPNGDVSVAEVD